jgi:hypothetical protein
MLLREIIVYSEYHNKSAYWQNAAILMLNQVVRIFNILTLWTLGCFVTKLYFQCGKVTWFWWFAVTHVIQQFLYLFRLSYSERELFAAVFCTIQFKYFQVGLSVGLYCKNTFYSFLSPAHCCQSVDLLWKTFTHHHCVWPDGNGSVQVKISLGTL